MSVIGKGVKEIRVWTKNTYRIFYVAECSEAIYVLHVFEKKTQKTNKKDLELGKKRYQQMIELRKEQEFN